MTQQDHRRVAPHGPEQTQHVGGEEVERVRIERLRLRTLAVAALVERHRVPALGGQRCEPVAEVLLGAREAVDEQQRPAALSLLDDAQLDAVDVDGALAHEILRAVSSGKALARAMSPSQCADGLGRRTKVARSTSTRPKRGRYP